MEFLCPLMALGRGSTMFAEHSAVKVSGSEPTFPPFETGHLMLQNFLRTHILHNLNRESLPRVEWEFPFLSKSSPSFQPGTLPKDLPL